MIISFILVTFLFYSGLILWGEIRCKSIFEFKGLTAKGFVDELDDRSLSIWIYTTLKKRMWLARFILISNGNRTEWSPIRSAIILVITSAIADQIGLHEVLLPINYKNYNLRQEKYSQVIKERENLH